MLREKAELYEHPGFLDCDPIQIPHQFVNPLDIEVSAFLVALISWGQRRSIVQSGSRLMEHMDWAPYQFVVHATEADLNKLEGFVHRTFNTQDLRVMLQSLRRLYREFGSMGAFFAQHQGDSDLQLAISELKSFLLDSNTPVRTRKHLADPARGSAAKRINMFLRWMVRPATRGVDFGIWSDVAPSKLSCPLDVHSGRVARQLGLLKRAQDDARAVLELDTALRSIDPSDPVRFDFALFGLGAYENFVG